MRILCFCEKWESGGIESFLTTTLEAMDRTGLSVEIAACLVKPGVYDARLSAMGIPLIALGTGTRDVAANRRAFQSLLRSERYDVVHLNLYEGLALGFARDAQAAGIPHVIVHSHNTDLRPSPTRTVKLAIHRLSVRRWNAGTADLWAPSQAAAHFLFDSRPWTLVHNGIHPGSFAFDPIARANVRARLGLDDGFVIGCVGRLCKQKNQAFLLDVLVLLPHARLLLVGEDDASGETQRYLEGRMKTLGIKDRVILYGASSTPSELYQAMDALCVPSLFEGLGIVAIEGQAAGLPTLCSPAVPPEAHIAPSTKSIELDAFSWARALTEIGDVNRSAGPRLVAAAGYDVRDVAMTVRNAYMRDASAPSSWTAQPQNAPLTEASDIVVSIVVPVFNVQDYLEECITSITTQTHRLLDIILVDDGSDDRSPAICDRLASADPRIRVIHQQNSGLSQARNRGLEEARGDFVAFVDADDVVSPLFIEMMLRQALLQGADLVQCPFCIDQKDLIETYAELCNARCEVLSGREASTRLQFDSTGAYTVAWNKLYSRRLADHLAFPPGKQHEDEFVSYRVLWEANIVCLTDAALYYYRQQPRSIMHQAPNAKQFDALEALQQRADFYREHGADDLADMTQAVLLHRLLRLISAQPNAALTMEPARLWCAAANQVLGRVVSSDSLTLRKKLTLSARMLALRLRRPHVFR